MATATAGFRRIHQKSIKGLAWASFILALAAGALLPGTFIGVWMSTAMGWLPWQPATSIIILIVGWGLVILDVWNDLEPNQGAVIGALLLPSVALSFNGGLAGWTRDLANFVLDAIDQFIFKAQPDGIGSTGLAIAVAVASLVVANRVVKKGRRG